MTGTGTAVPYPSSAHQLTAVYHNGTAHSPKLTDSDSDEDSDSDLDMNSSSSSSSSDFFTLDGSGSSDPGEPTAAELYINHMAELYSQCYLAERQHIPKSKELMQLLLVEYKLNRPEIFRSYLCITPDCFDELVNAIEDDEIFHRIHRCLSKSKQPLRFIDLVIMVMQHQ